MHISRTEAHLAGSERALGDVLEAPAWSACCVAWLGGLVALLAPCGCNLVCIAACKHAVACVTQPPLPAWILLSATFLHVILQASKIAMSWKCPASTCETMHIRVLSMLSQTWGCSGLATSCRSNLPPGEDCVKAHMPLHAQRDHGKRLSDRDKKSPWTLPPAHGAIRLRFATGLPYVWRATWAFLFTRQQPMFADTRM